MTEARKENIINDIIIELEKGNSYVDSITPICAKFRFSNRTFDKYWKIANDRFSERQQRIKEELTTIGIDREKERLKKAILTREQRMIIAAKIATGVVRRVEDELIIPTDGDRLKALDYLSKIEGDYTSKIQLSGDKENPIHQNITVEIIDGYKAKGD